jgi:micrococcal nuclease
MKLANVLTVVGVVGAAALLALPVVAGSDEEAPHAVTAKCIKVVDGDTIIVKCDRREMTVELEGVDAPELDQPWGKEVRSFVRDMVQGHAVTVEPVAGGSTARVTVDGLDLAELLAARGLAWATDEGELAELAAKARSAPCGIWLDPEPVPPWEFRDANA